MKHVKKLLALFLIMLMVATLPTTALAKMSDTTSPATQLELIDFSTVRLVQCLSAATHFLDDDTEELPLGFGLGYTFSVLPGTTFIPVYDARFLHGFDPWSKNNPAMVSIAYSQLNLEGDFVPEGYFTLYPFRQLAENLGYDVLWRNIDGVSYVFFAEHVEGGAWIHVSLENLILPKVMNIDLSEIETRDQGWMYANSVTVNGEYNVQFDKDGEVTVPSYWVTEVIPVDWFACSLENV